MPSPPSFGLGLLTPCSYQWAVYHIVVSFDGDSLLKDKINKIKVSRRVLIMTDTLLFIWINNLSLGLWTSICIPIKTSRIRNREIKSVVYEVHLPCRIKSYGKFLKFRNWLMPFSHSNEDGRPENRSINMLVLIIRGIHTWWNFFLLRWKTRL